MPDSLGPASEFGGKVRLNRTQPPPHVPTPSERLMLMYTTGDESGMLNPDLNGDVFSGFLPAVEQRAAMEAAGLMVKGEGWALLQQEGSLEITDLAGEGETIA